MAEEKGHLTRKQQMTIMYQSFSVFLYNKDTGEVMGRNAESWGMWSSKTAAAVWGQISNFSGFVINLFVKFT